MPRLSLGLAIRLKALLRFTQTYAQTQLQRTMLDKLCLTHLDLTLHICLQRLPYVF